MKKTSTAMSSTVRCLKVLELLAEEPFELSFTELAARLNVPKASAHRLCTTLVEVVAENVAFPMLGRADAGSPKDIDTRVKELLAMLEVSEFTDRLPADLSTGTKRAVAIARALAENPEAILYDEPTTMVDPLMAAHISDLILKLKKTLQKTSIVVTHDTHLGKKLADRVIFLQEGRVTFFGTWKELEATPDPFLRNFLQQDELIPALDATA